MKPMKKEITNRDLFGLITKLDTKIGSLDTKIDTVEKSLNSKIDTVEKSLSKQIKANTEHIKANTDLIENLAMITNKGFVAVDKKFEQVDARLNTLEIGQEDILLRLNQVPYDFEMKELSGRVKILETKILKPGV